MSISKLIKNVFLNNKETQIKNNDNSSLKEKYNKYINLIENSTDNDKTTIARYLIAIIVEYLNNSKAVKSLELENNQQDNSLIELIYKSIERELLLDRKVFIYQDVHPDDLKYYTNSTIVDSAPIVIEINKLPILLNPWNGDRIISNLMEIGENGNFFDGVAYNSNIQNHYLYPMDIIVCSGANHSQFSARFKNQGKTTINTIYNFSQLYEKVFFDGDNFIHKDNKSIFESISEYDKEIVFYSGIIFELGRYILVNNYHSLNQTKKLN